MMGQSAESVVELGPIDAFSTLKSPENSLLIDVRTKAEWSFVGAPDLSGIGGKTVFIEWQSFPSMAVNPGFAEQALAAAEAAEAKEILFICRSGGRSMHAALATLAAAKMRDLTLSCINVAEGFEGDLDATGRRGRVNGWKARDLPWRQS